MSNIQHLLQTANFEYNRGNLPSAKKYTEDALRQLESIHTTPDSPLAMTYFETLTLVQSIASKTHDLVTYERYEPQVKDWTLCLFGNSSYSYYGFHLMDVCDCYLSAGDIAKGQPLLEQAISILEDENGTCPLLDLMYYSHAAKLFFKQEQFHQCIDIALQANSCWLQSPLIPENATPFLQKLSSNGSLIAQIGCYNLVLLACAYGKVNTPENGIPILLNLLDEPIMDYYFKSYVEITLTELYTRAGNYSEARKLYQKYKTINPATYPDLYMAVTTLANVLDSQNPTMMQTPFAAQHDGQLATSTCYSKDGIQIMLYNQGLKLIAARQYAQALTLYRQLENRGLSLQLFLLAKTGNYNSIPDVKRKADQYFDREIRNLFLYYNEQLVHNHLSLLEYHFSLCMDAYLACHEQLGESELSTKEIYDFLLNTKYISLEAAYLSRNYQTFEELNERKSFTCNEIMETLSSQDVLLEYCITRTVDESYYCVFVITRTNISCIRLEQQSVIDKLVTKWHTLMQQSAHATVSDNAAILHDIKENETLLRRYLYRPIKEILSTLSANHMIISPAGSLIHFPFCTLPVSSSAYLGEQFEITYVNTAKELITNPLIEAPVFDSALIAGGPAYQQFPPLPYAKLEAEIAAACIHSRCFSDTDVSSELFEYCVDGAPALVHIAAHGIFHEVQHTDHTEHTDNWNTAFQVMENSGLVLANDELLSCNTISSMDFSETWLTILSACQTGKGLFHSAEGVYGLRRAFRLAGCHSMIVTLWQINDRCACYFMERFYEHMIKNALSPRQAFFLAIEDVKSYTEDTIHPFSHPYYWSGYIFIE